MKKFVSESWLVLTMGVVFACLLAATQTSLSGRIVDNQQRALNQAILEVVPGLERTEELVLDGNRVFKCTDAAGNLLGWAVEASGAGFVDKITLVAGLSVDGGRVTGVKVIDNLETPGLGNKIEGPWAAQWRDRDATRAFSVTKATPTIDQNEISAITGATYSSVYVTNIVNDVLTRIRPLLAEHR